MEEKLIQGGITGLIAGFLKGYSGCDFTLRI